MTRHHSAFGLFVALWLGLSALFVGAPARAYEEQASLDLALGYTSLRRSTELPPHGAHVELGGSFGLGDPYVLRGQVGYLALLAGRGTVHGARARVEALYLVDILQVVPFFGLGASVLFGALPGEGLLVRPGAHLVLGANYLVSRTWTLGVDLRTGLSVESGRLLPLNEFALRLSRMFETF